MARVAKLNEELFNYIHHSKNHYTKQTCILLRCGCARGTHSSAAPKKKVLIWTFKRTSNRHLGMEERHLREHSKAVVLKPSSKQKVKCFAELGLVT